MMKTWLDESGDYDDIQAAVMTSPEVTARGQHCVSFHYMRQGVYAGLLQVSVVYSTGQTEVLATLTGDHGPAWRQKWLDLKPPQSVVTARGKLSLQFTVPYTTYSQQAAIDNISLTDAKCPHIGSLTLKICTAIKQKADVTQL